MKKIFELTTDHKIQINTKNKKVLCENLHMAILYARKC